MYLSEMRIENYRLFRDVTISLDRNLTLFVGKNNSGKTSIANLLCTILSEKPTLRFDDYPLEAREELYSAIGAYWQDDGQSTLDELRHSLPIAKVTLTFDYSDKTIGNVSDFIIDLDEEVYTAIVVAAFELSDDAETVLGNARIRYEKLSDPKGESGNERSRLVHLVKDIFSGLFKLQVYAVNPSDSEDVLPRNQKTLRELFSFKVIRAERAMDESDTAEQNPLGKALRSLFESERSQVEEDIRPSLDALDAIVDTESINLQNRLV